MSKPAQELVKGINSADDVTAEQHDNDVTNSQTPVNGATKAQSSSKDIKEDQTNKKQKGKKWKQGTNRKRGFTKSKNVFDD